MINFGMISSATTVFDYGCGLGQDVEILTENGYRAFGWDPNHRPDAERREADVVNLGFVVNVIEDRRERDATLRDAWSYARRGMTVSAMLSAKADVSGQRPHGDGYLTKRSTFQRYYTQPELLDWVGSTLGETPVSLGPGIVSVFKDKDFEQEVNFRRRSRARTLAGLLDLPARSARRQPPPRRTRERDIEAEIEALWQLSLSLGRAPAADEVPTALAARIAGAGASLRAATRAMLDARETKTLDAVAEARKEDLLVHGALSIFPGAPKYASLPLSLQRDIRHFYGSASALKALATDELAALRRAEHIEEAIWKAEAEGLASRENGIVRLSMRNETRLPVPLRIMLGCADVVFPGFSQMDAVEIGPKHANLRGFLCRDFDAAIPRVAEVVSVDLAAARFRRDAPRDRVLYLKALFLSNDDPSRAKQEAIDRRLVEAGLVDAEGRGPSGKELGSILAAAIRVDG
jgi:DNA phosphorothioation-associated putative methyltransferase